MIDAFLNSLARSDLPWGFLGGALLLLGVAALAWAVIARYGDVRMGPDPVQPTVQLTPRSEWPTNVHAHVQEPRYYTPSVDEWFPLAETFVRRIDAVTEVIEQLTSSPCPKAGDSPRPDGRDGWLAFRRPGNPEVSTPSNGQPGRRSEVIGLAIADRSDARDGTTPGLRPTSSITDVAVTTELVITIPEPEYRARHRAREDDVTRDLTESLRRAKELNHADR